MQNIPPVSSAHASPQLQASKWMAQQALLDFSEMQELFAILEQPQLYLCGSLWTQEQFKEHKKVFLEFYQSYVEKLKNGEMPDLTQCRTYFSACLTETSDAVYLQDAQQEQYILRPKQPIIQLQHHTMNYSPHDEKMRSMVFGKDIISWGIQFSYPQMYLDTTTNTVKQTNEGSHPNGSLFKTLQRWLRQHSLPITFIVEGKAIPTAIRLGKKCTEWIKNEPQLQKHQLQIQ